MGYKFVYVDMSSLSIISSMLCYNQGCIKPPKFIFLPPPPTFENHFFILLTTFSNGAVGYNIWWQLWDTTFGGSCGIQHFVAAVGYKFTKKLKNKKNDKKIKKHKKS